MPRFLRRNLAIGGLRYDDSKSAPALTNPSGIYTPASGASGQLIVPQVIPWPWATDDAGVAYPSGLVGIRSVAMDRATERAWATPGDPQENADVWMAVPDTLPSGYTARISRDHDRGPRGTSETRGTPYMVPSFDSRGLSYGAFQDAVNWNEFTYEMYGGFSMNNQTPGLIAGNCPSYRPNGGGGVVKLGWYPLNLSKKTPACYQSIDSPWPQADLDPVFAGIYYSGGKAGLGLWTRQSPGFRNIRIRVVVATTSINWSRAVEDDIALQFIVKHNANGSVTGTGDTVDYLSPVYTKSAFTDSYSPGGGLGTAYALTKDIPVTWNPTKAQGMRRWRIGYTAGAKLNGGNVAFGGGPGWGFGTNFVPTLWLSPRVDIPPHFSVYGAGIGAPGGV